MLLTITCEGSHAKDFGYVIAKHPASVFERDLAYGRLTLFYTENEPERATVALMFDIDALSLVRGGNRAAAIDQFVNDLPYVASNQSRMSRSPRSPSRHRGDQRLISWDGSCEGKRYGLPVRRQETGIGASAAGVGGISASATATCTDGGSPATAATP